MSNIEINNVLAQMRAMSSQVKSPEVEVASASNSKDFSTMLSDSINAVNQTQMQAGSLSTAFVKGETDASLAEVMVSLQKANISFQTVLQTRNKLIDAYRDVMRMTM
ncbi:MAG: flagellar hook-basal body complex protein FliE [Piscirickettsiaceae bacterium]|nr:MAG: flagellar hook-basal body complex protein FliE [Piscirickettsiaceae bacterium]PCI70995.1 MAG: flagellar hook-basal body complex protein FliE [Piscirickettsiaceae bacterium]